VEEFSFTQCRLQLTVGEETKENARGFEVWMRDLNVSGGTYLWVISVRTGRNVSWRPSVGWEDARDGGIVRLMC
jgi:hypothetical protein